ncbi:MAG: FecR family protein [Candidatus Firestonebacteria bacterium]
MYKNFLIGMFLCFVFAITTMAEQSSFVTITELSGEVEVSIAGGEWQQVNLNQNLNTADKIRTKNGKAELKFSNGTTLNLRENSNLDLVQIKSTNNSQNSILKLFFGKIKAKVSKLNQDDSFEIHSPKVIAAVKGTEFVMETTNEETEVLVLEGIVALSDILREKEIFIKENEKAYFKEGLLNNPRELSPEEQKTIKEIFETGMKLEKPTTAQTIGIEDDSKNLQREIRELRSDLLEIKDRSNLEDKQDLLERISDVQLGKSAMDMHGYRVRTDNYVLRPKPNTIMMLNITKREGGPNAGVSSLEISDIFNKDLPKNFMDVKIALYGDDWFNPDKPLEYYLTKEISVLRNPFGDTIKNIVNFDDPIFDNSGDFGFYRQPFIETFKINDVEKWEFKLTYNNIAETFNKAEYIDLNGVHMGQNTSGNPNLPFDVELSLTKEGGFMITHIYPDETYFKTGLYLVDDSGTVHSVLDVFNSVNFYEFQNTLLKYNWELVYEATEFDGRTIDLIVLPKIFNELY